MSSANMRTTRAVIWFTRLQEGSMTERRRHKLEQWLAIPANQREFESAQAAWHNTPSAEAAERLVSESHTGSRTKALELASAARASYEASDDKKASSVARAAPTHAARPTMAEPGSPCTAAAEPIRERGRLRSEQAAYWFIRCTDEVSMPRLDRRAFVQWMRQSAENIAELLEMAQLHDTLRRIKAGARARRSTTSNVIELPRVGSTHEPSRAIAALAEARDHDGAKNKRAFSLNVAAVAAAIFLGLPLAFVAQHHLSAKQVIVTGASQWHRMTLPDGTVVHIDACSRVEIGYSKHARIVHLYEGAAVFEVTKDAKRPFIARTSLVDARAVGTRFGISLHAGVTTTVSEGVVEVSVRGRAERQAMTLNAGEELHVSDDVLRSSHLAPVDAERKLQWAKGMLQLGGMTIAEGVEQMNRRNRTQIVVETPTLAPKVVEVANVKVGSPEEYAKIIAAEPGVTMIVDEAKGLIRLSE